MAPKAAAWSVVNFHYNNIFDNTAAKLDLDFRYTIPWAEGVRRMVAWHDARGSIDSSPDDPLYNKIVDVWRMLGESVVPRDGIVGRLKAGSSMLRPRQPSGNAASPSIGGLLQDIVITEDLACEN